VPVKVFDCHHGVSNHLELSLAPRERFPQLTMNEWLDQTVTSHIARLDAGGVDQAAIHASVGYRRSAGLDAMCSQNNCVARYRDRSNGRLPAAFGVAEPLFADDALPEIERCKHELGLTGIGFHPRFQGVSTENYWILRFVERILDLGMLPVLRGMGETVEEELWKVAQVAKAFPDSEILVLDVFSTWEGSSWAYTIAAECPNLTFNTALAYEFEMVAPFIDVVGSKRVVFGSDLHHPAPPTPRRGMPGDRFTRVGWMVPPMKIARLKDELIASSLPDDEKYDVLWGNSARLFRLSGASPHSPR
jgi:predicted TIM-barrel fold metal-dependent hydrolase